MRMMPCDLGMKRGITSILAAPHISLTTNTPRATLPAVRASIAHGMAAAAAARIA